MMRPERQPGGTSDSIVDLLSVLSERSNAGDDLRKNAALFNAAEILQTILAGALSGDESCGNFLGEWIPSLSKSHERLSEANDRYRRRSSRIGGARLGRSPLRLRIEQMIADAQWERRSMRVAERMPGLKKMAKRLKRGDVVFALPDLDSSDAAPDEWFNKFVYPELEKQRRALRDDPQIGSIKKAFDRNGKFQISRLRKVIRDHVRRIAAKPKTYYVDPHFP